MVHEEAADSVFVLLPRGAAVFRRTVSGGKCGREDG